MTVVSLQADSTAAKPTQSEILYRAWRYAGAQWELAANDPASPEGLSDEENDRFCDVEHEALIAYFQHPADGPGEVSRKMRTFQERQGWVLSEAPEIFSQLVRDVRTLTNGREG